MEAEAEELQKLQDMGIWWRVRRVWRLWRVSVGNLWLCHREHRDVLMSRVSPWIRRGARDEHPAAGP